MEQHQYQCLYCLDWAPLFSGSILSLPSVVRLGLFASVHPKFEFHTREMCSAHYFIDVVSFVSFLVSNRNACGSTRMQRSGLPSSESFVPLTRA